MARWTLSARKDMRNYQWKAIKFGLAAPRNAMFLDMGLGKTTITLHTIQSLKHKGELGGRPVLIVAPIRVIHNVWRQEAEKWEHTRGLTFSIMHGSARRRLAAFNADADIMLINPENLLWLNKLLAANGYAVKSVEYDEAWVNADNQRRLRWQTPDQPVELRKMPEREWPFSMLVVDESSKFKNSGTKTWAVLRDWAPIFKRASLLTGTPTPNTMLELWPQLYLLDAGQRLGKTKTYFRDRFFYKADYMGYDYKLRRGADETINKLISDVVMRLDAKDWLDMPEVIRNVIDVELPQEVMERYKQFEDDMFLEMITSSVEAISAASLTMRCHQFANGAMYARDNETSMKVWEPLHDTKLDALEEVISEAGGNVMVAYQYKHDLERLKQKYPAARVLGGGTTGKETTDIINEWNAGTIPILLVHPASAGHGLNLQHGGHTIVFFSLTWSLEQHDQLIARLHRSGQTERVVVHYLRAKDTVDELIYGALQSKARSQQDLLNALREYSIKRNSMQGEIRVRDTTAEAEVQRIEGGQQ